MQPQNPTPQPQMPPVAPGAPAPQAKQPLDQDAVNLAKAIRQNESSGNFTARGKSGEYGAYQFTPATWGATAPKYLGRQVNLDQATPEEQNEVAYKQIKEWKDKGMNVGQIASMWNSGKPDAYLDPAYKGTNKHGADFGVPKYAENIAKTYQSIKSGQGAPDLGGPSTVEQPQENKPGFIQTAAQTIARPFLKAVSNVGGALEAGKGLIKEIAGKDTTQEKANYEKIQKEGLDFGYFGKAKPIGSEYDDKGEKKAFGHRVADTIGTGLEASTFIAPGGAAVKTAQAVRGGRALSVAAKGAFTGAEAGLLQGAGSGLQKDDATISSVATDAALTGVGGAVTGGTLGLIGGQLGKLGGKGKQNAAVNSNTAGLSEIENANAPLRRYVEEQRAAGFDVKKDIASTDLLKGAVDKEGIIRTLGDGGPVSQYQKAIEESEGVVRNVLEKEGATIKASDLQKKAFDSIKRSGLQGAAKKRAEAEAMADINAFIEDVGSDDIPLALVHDAKVSRYRTLNYSNPESGITGKALAKGYKEAVETGTKSVQVKDINQELKRHFANIGFLEKLDGKRVQGGRLGKYFAQTVGGIAGSHFGPLGTIVGADVAGRIMGHNLSSKFGGKTGGLIPEASSAMKRAIRIGEGSERKLPVKSLPSEYTDELPVIEAGKKPVPKKKKGQKGLITIR